MIALLATLLLAATDPQLVGSWSMGGDGNLVFKADGSGSLDGEPFKWSVKSGVLTVSYVDPDEGSDQMSYALKGDSLTIAMAGLPITMQRVGKAPKATSKTAAPVAPKPVKAGNDKLSKLLLSSAWCSLSFKGGSTGSMSYGTTSSARVQFSADGTFSYTARGEISNSAASGSYAGQSSGSVRGQWKVKDNDLWIYLPPEYPAMTKTNTQVTYNSNGHPILEGQDGVEYMMCK